MAKLGRACSICSDPARRAAVDGALLAGSTPAEVARLYKDTFDFSMSGLYRHARHAHTPSVALSVPLPEGEAPADALRVLIAVQSSQLAALERADRAGDDKLAASAADRLRAITRELMDAAGIDAANIADTVAVHAGLITGIRRAALKRPELARDLADTFREVGDPGNADALDALATYAFTRTTTN
jgi:hypothetical protein